MDPANNPLPPPALYAVPPRSFKFPLWAKAIIGCGALLLVLFVVLAAGLMRRFASGRGALQTQFCFDNLRAAQRGVSLYSQDYDGTLPQSGVWMDATLPYLKNNSNLACPAVRTVDAKAFGYAFNRKLSGVSLAKIDAPATALIYDSSDLKRNASDDFLTLPTPPRHPAPRIKALQNGPKTGNLVVYADGHVTFVGADKSSTDISKMKVRRLLFAPPPRTK
jgi:hypothetical protein